MCVYFLLLLTFFVSVNSSISTTSGTTTGPTLTSGNTPSTSTKGTIKKICSILIPAFCNTATYLYEKYKPNNNSILTIFIHFSFNVFITKITQYDENIEFITIIKNKHKNEMESNNLKHKHEMEAKDSEIKSNNIRHKHEMKSKDSEIKSNNIIHKHEMDSKDSEISKHKHEIELLNQKLKLYMHGHEK